MMNMSGTSTSFVLLGVVELEKLKYLYSAIAIVMYIFIMFTCVMVIYLCRTEKSLHEPMYFFIFNIVTNVILGSTAFFPKLTIDLLTGCSTITLHECLIQAFCIQSAFCFESCTFAAMAYDRYLAVGHPLRYHNLMTNEKVLTLTIVLWSIVFTMQMTVMILCSKLTFCWMNIDNIYCESDSLLHLACSDITIVNLFGSVWFMSMLSVTITVSVYCYIGTFIICLNISLEASQKAIHTLVTNIITFSLTLLSGVFVVFRYKLNDGSVNALTHVVISMLGLWTGFVINPLIYGIRTKALRTKMMQLMKNMFQWTRKCLCDK